MNALKRSNNGHPKGCAFGNYSTKLSTTFLAYNKTLNVSFIKTSKLYIVTIRSILSL